MSENYFIFNGMDSRDLGVRVKRMPPRVMPARRYEEHRIAGRHGVARIWDGAYEPVQLPVELYLPYEQGGTVAALPTIMRALDGCGWLTLSDRPGRRFWATVTGEASYEAWVEGYAERVCTVTFEADPQAWHTENPAIAVAASGDSVTNPGTQISEPVVTVTGSGEVLLMIGQQITTLQLGESGGTMTVDAASGAVTMGGEMVEDGLEGDWPVLQPGANAVSWSGSVTAVSITVNPFDIGA